MTAARSARRQAVLAARADVTVRGPILAPLACGCVVDSEGGVWQPCIDISIDHGRAVQHARLGFTRGIESSADLAATMARITAHVAEQERAVHGLAEQAVML